MGINGLLTDVRWEWTGTELTMDLVAGTTVLPVLDPESITEEEFVWVAGTGPYEIVDVDVDGAIFTIAPGLEIDVDAGTEVANDVGGQPGRAWVCEVVLADADRPVEVPLTIHDLAVMPEGTYDPPVVIVLTDDLEHVENLPGSLPIVDGVYIPAGTLPPGPQGVPGPPGADGSPQYTWVKYADSPTTGMSDLPAGKAYMGLSYNHYDPTESTNYSDYQWSKVQGDPGPPAGVVDLTSNTQVLTQPAAGGATVPATATVTGTAQNTTISVYEYSSDGTPFSGTVPAGVSRAGNVVTITGATMVAKSITVRMADAAGISDSLSVARVQEGAGGAPGPQGPPGVGVSGTAVTYQVHTNGTTAPTGAWVATPPATTPGTFLWTRTITTYTDASTTTAYSVAAHGTTGLPGAPGADGDDGSPGAPGRGVSSTAVTYQVGGSGTTAPVGTWVASPPATSPGQFLWTRTITTYTDATTSTAYSVAAHGATGTPGADGAPGVGITGTVVTYQVGNSGTTAPTGVWAANPQATTPGTFLWTRTITSYSSGAPTTAYSVAAHGTTGSTGGTGTPGVGIAGTTVTYQVHTNGTTAPTGTWQSSPQATTTGQFLWTRTITTYTDASTPTTAYSVSAHGATGSQGIQGPAGSQGIQGPAGPNGQTLYTWVKYADSPTTGMSDLPAGKTYMGLAYNKTSSTESSVYTDYEWSLIQGPQGDTGVAGPPGANGQPTYTWIKYADSATGAGINDLPAGKTYMGIAYNKTTPTESSVTTDYEWSLIQGPQGATGAAGVGVSSTAVTYQVHSNGTTAPTGTWQPTPQVTTPGTFLWTRTITTYTNASTTTAYSVSAHGSTGSTGSPGNPGAPGVGITGTTVTYQVGNSGTTAPVSTWQATPQATTPGTFLWTRTVTNYSDSTSSTAYSVSAHGATGSTGSPGSPGAPGVGITGTVVTYQVGSSGTTAPVGTWQTTPQVTTPGTFLWTRTVTTYSDTTTSTGYSVSAHGTTGAPGTAGVGVSSTAVTYQTASSGTVAPTGTWVGSPPATSPGQFLWTRTITTYTDTTTVTAYSVAAHGTTGNPGADAYTISQSNEAHTFPGSVTAALAGSTTTTFTSYKGATPINAAVNNAAITGAPTGMTTAVTGSPGSPVVTVTVTTALVQQNGVLTIPVVVDGFTFNKLFSWSVSRQGTNGTPGTPGADGTPRYTWTKYADNATGTVGFSDTPTATSKYLGMAYNQTTLTESNSPGAYEWSLIQGPQGPTGPQGPPGVPPTNGLAPSSSKAPNAIGGIGAVYVSNYAVVNPDPVTYELHMSVTPGFTAAPATLAVITDDTVKTLRVMPDGSAIPYDTDLYFRSVARDADGSAPASTITGPIRLMKITGPDIAAATIQGVNITGQTITGDLFAATVVMAGEFITATQGQRARLSTDGFTIFGPDGGAMVDLPAVQFDPANPNVIKPATFKGRAEFEYISTPGLTITGSGSQIANSATLELAAGVQPSTNPPTPIIDYEEDTTSGNWPTFPYEGLAGYAPSTMDGHEAFITAVWGAPGRFYVKYGAVWEGYNFSGVGTTGFYAAGIVHHHTGDGWIITGRDKTAQDSGATIANQWKAMHVRINRTGTPTLEIVTQSALGFCAGIAVNNPWVQVGTGMNYTTTAGVQQFFMSWVNPATRITEVRAYWMDGVAGQTAWSLAGTAQLASTVTTGDGNTSGEVSFGFFDGVQTGGMTNGIYAMACNGTVHFWDNTGAQPYARMPTIEFPEAPVDGQHLQAYTLSSITSGVATYTYTGFRQYHDTSVDTVRIIKYGTNMWTATNDQFWWCAYAWWNDASGKHTSLSSRALVTMKKRARLILSSSAIPVGEGGPDNPDSVHFFIGKGTATVPPPTTAMWYQSDPYPFDVTHLMTDAVFSGAAASAVCPTTTFPTALGGVIKGAGVRKNTSERLVSIAGSGPANLDGLIPPGTMVMWAALVAPPGWVICDGSLLSRTLYPDLFFYIGTTFGAGDGTTTFAIPDMMGRHPVGMAPLTTDSVFKTLGYNEGNTNDAAGQTSRSSRSRHLHTHTISGEPYPTGVARGTATPSGEVVSKGAYDGHSHGGVTGSRATNNTTDTLHAILTLQFIIKT
jgi:microcystin-dependent protein